MTCDKTMKPIEIIELLNQELGSQASPIQAWEIFKKFDYQKVNSEDEYLLFQVGDSGAIQNSYLDFCYGFQIEDEEGDTYWEQVHIEFSVDFPNKLNMNQIDLMSDDCESVEQFFAQVESMSEFETAINYDKWTLSIYHTEV